jgi:alpha-galactosidase
MTNVNICIIGGGGRAWAITFMRDLAGADDVQGKICLYDIDHEAASNNVEVGNRIFRLNGKEGRFHITSCPSLAQALEGSDLVVISIEPGKTSYRYNDLIVPEQYGVLQTVGDTTGPGGIFRARRALPMFFDIGKSIERHCPEAWVINYTNPMTLCTAALYQAFPAIKAMGCCHEVFHIQTFLAKKVSTWFGVETPNRREIAVDISGVNHFTFATKASWKGKDLMGYVAALCEDSETFGDTTDTANKRLKAEKWFEGDHTIALDFYRNFGALGAAGDRHLAEFVPWYLADEKELHSFGIVRTPYAWREREAVRKREKLFTDDELISKETNEEGVDILRSLMGARTFYTNINVPNQGQVPYLPLGHIVESNGFISHNSIKPSLATLPPLAIQTLERHVAEVQELTLKAALQQDDKLLLQAFLNDPLMRLPLSKAKALFREMLENANKQN